MNKLIEPIGSIECYRMEVCYESDVRELEQLSNEMLEALINDIRSYEFSPGDLFGISCYKRNIGIIEKATNKSWEEIRSLYNG